MTEKILPPGFVLEAAGSVFDGLTEEKVQIINGALYGHRVRVYSKRDDVYGPEQRSRLRDEVYVFLGMQPDDGGRTRDPLAAVWDLRLQKSQGIYRCVSPSLLTYFEILDREPLLQCADCFAWKPRIELRDFGLGFNLDFPEQPEWRTRLACERGDCG